MWIETPTLELPSGSSISFMAVFSIKATSAGVEKTGSNPEPKYSASLLFTYNDILCELVIHVKIIVFKDYMELVSCLFFHLFCFQPFHILVQFSSDFRGKDQ